MDGSLRATPEPHRARCAESERRRAQGGLSLRPGFGPEPERSVTWRAGLRPHPTIVALDGDRPGLAGRAFLVGFRERDDPGDRVEWTALEGDTTRTIGDVLSG